MKNSHWDPHYRYWYSSQFRKLLGSSWNWLLLPNAPGGYGRNMKFKAKHNYDNPCFGGFQILRYSWKIANSTWGYLIDIYLKRHTKIIFCWGFWFIVWSWIHHLENREHSIPSDFHSLLIILLLGIGETLSRDPVVGYPFVEIPPCLSYRISRVA